MIYLIIYHFSHQRKRHQLLSCHAVNIILWNPKCRREEITQHGPANMNSTVNNRCYEILMENNPEAICPLSLISCQLVLFPHTYVTTWLKDCDRKLETTPIHCVQLTSTW